MAISGEQSASKPIETSSEILDIHIDPQYSKNKSNPESYAREPWKCFENLVYAYLSARKGKWDRFKENMTRDRPAEWERVDHEIERIRNLRHRFEKDPLKQELMQELDNSREAWKKEVKASYTKLQEEVKEDTYISRHQRYLTGLDKIKSENTKETQNTDEEQESDGFKACVMYFKKSKSESNSLWEGYTHPETEVPKYPNQKMLMRDILKPGAHNPLPKVDKDTFRYFHFPANNMEWIETAIAILYGETPKRHDTTTKTGKLLAREFWRGQMHGSGGRGNSHHEPQTTNGGQVAMTGHTGPLHARHMRSRCSVIPRAPSQNGKAGKNIAIFLPYLHWEESSRRARMVQVADEVIGLQGKRRKDRKEVADIVAEGKKKKSTKKQRICR
ncbi:hypothetical protein HD806DRAFT_547355 [Xylariaceae sp. AK1471]|nr:hypothetical protein HD806DRAFT_547355 [Xylariaceae sp. AK1471]